MRRGAVAVTSGRVEPDEPSVPFGSLRPTERRALIGSAFAAGCICLIPQQLAAAGIAFAFTAILGVWHLARSRRERDAAARENRAREADS